MAALLQVVGLLLAVLAAVLAGCLAVEEVAEALAAFQLELAA